MLSMQLRVEIPDFVNDSSQESGFDVDLFLPGSSTTKKKHGSNNDSNCLTERE